MSAAAQLAASPDRAALLKGIGDWRALLYGWRFWADARQLPPPGDWRVWLMLAGRGFGKTRAGAEWVRSVAERDGSARIALTAAAAWSYPLGREVIWYCGAGAAAATMLMGIGPLRRAWRIDRASG